MAKQLGLHEVVRNGGAVDLYIRGAAAGEGGGVDGAGQNFLAGARLAGDEDGVAGEGRLTALVQQGADGGVLADIVVEGIGAGGPGKTVVQGGALAVAVRQRGQGALEPVGVQTEEHAKTADALLSVVDGQFGDDVVLAVHEHQSVGLGHTGAGHLPQMGVRIQLLDGAAHALLLRQPEVPEGGERVAHQTALRVHKAGGGKAGVHDLVQNAAPGIHLFLCHVDDHGGPSLMVHFEPLYQNEYRLARGILSDGGKTSIYGGSQVWYTVRDAVLPGSFTLC